MAGGVRKRSGAGRPKGSQNKASIARQAAVAASGLTPLDFMLDVMRNEALDLPIRLDAGKNAAPYVHPKLSAITHSGPGGGPIQSESRSDRDLAMAILDMLRRGQKEPSGAG